ncbi:MAG: PD40 domain-containing protein [Xanthomonadales bacterium]|nr:PD40 domain-containing protein [Xanthomonadales bacterium]
MRRWIAGSVLALLSAWVVAEPAYYRDPAIHQDTVVFSAEGDLWRVSVDGGSAQRLTTDPGQETQPQISPDGKQIAFVASYHGVPEVYLMPMAGGIPRQLSFDASRVMLSPFAPTGEVVYASGALIGPAGTLGLRMVDPRSGRSRNLPLAEANQAGFDEQGQRLWFTRFGLQVSTDNALDYRGGAMARLYQFDLGSDREAQPVAADWSANLIRPMVWQGRIYLIADADGRPNLWSMLPDGSDRRALTQHRDFSVSSASLHDGRIVYQHGADLRLYDIAQGNDRLLSISLASDFAQRQPRFIKNPLKFAESLYPDPRGSQVALTARGQVLLASVGPRRRVELAIPGGARAREAVLIGDGKRTALILDHDGKSELWSFPSDGSGPGERLVGDAGTHLWRLFPSPDGRWLAYADKLAQLWLLDLNGGNPRMLERGAFGGDDGYAAVVWSADNRYLALARPDSAMQRNQIVLVEVASGRRAVLTSDRYESFAPGFSADGQWLYFLSNRQLTPTPSSPWGDRNTGAFFDKRAQLYALALQPGLRFPFAPNDELAPAPAKKAEKDEPKPAAPLPAVAFDGLAQRLYQAPLPAGNYSALAVAKERLYLLELASVNDQKGKLIQFAITSDNPRPETFAEDLSAFALSADRSKLMLVKAPADPNIGLTDVYVVEAAAKPPEKLPEFQLRLAGWSLEVSPPAEWRQMYADAWRMHAQFSFDPSMRGQDWTAVYHKYAALLPRLADRADLDDLLAQMSAEHGILHSQVRGSDLRSDPNLPAIGTLGARYVQTDQGLELARIFRSDPELPAAAGPLRQPGVDAEEGDRLISVDGRPVANQGDLAAALRERVGQQVLLVLQRGERSPHRTVVIPISPDADALLRYGDWVEGRRLAVEQAGDGRLGYLHLRAMGAADMANFVREFYAQYDREGLIIDVRRNRGGNIDSWIIDKLLRRTWAFWQQPGFNNRNWNMQQSFRGHLVVLADQYTYSDGETFAAGVKALGLGPVIGMRTAGAGIWLSGRNRLLDGGMARIAEFPQYDHQGRWLIEGNGVAPDIEVDNLPYETAKGGDAQLDRGIAELLARLQREPIPDPAAQPLPVRGTPAHDGSR